MTDIKPVLVRWPTELLRRARAKVGARGLNAYVLSLVERDLSPPAPPAPMPIPQRRPAGVVHTTSAPAYVPPAQRRPAGVAVVVPPLKP